MMNTKPQPMELKIAYIGGGSRGWAHNLMNDLALCPDLLRRGASLRYKHGRGKAE
jgi:hypothetical protein